MTRAATHRAAHAAASPWADFAPLLARVLLSLLFIYSGIGKLMGALKPKLAGQADMGLVSKLVKQQLG